MLARGKGGRSASPVRRCTPSVGQLTYASVAIYVYRSPQHEARESMRKIARDGQRETVIEFR